MTQGVSSHVLKGEVICGKFDVPGCNTPTWIERLDDQHPLQIVFKFLSSSSRIFIIS